MTNHETDGPAFTMEDGDLFRRVLISDPVTYSAQQGAMTVVAFFVVERASGLCDIVNVTKTVVGDVVVSRKAQVKPDIRPADLDNQVDEVRITFALAVERATGMKLRWHELDLTGTDGLEEQVKRIDEWQAMQAWGESVLGM